MVVPLIGHLEQKFAELHRRRNIDGGTSSVVMHSSEIQHGVQHARRKPRREPRVVMLGQKIMLSGRCM